MNQQIYVTEEKKQALKQELKELVNVKRKSVLEAIEYAKSLGDLSENAEYHQAREDQGKLEERISQIEHILKESVVVEKHHSVKVEIGSTVLVRKDGSKEEKKYQIVGSEEVDIKENKISYLSPLGAALFGKVKGDTVSFKTPSASVNYKIISIE